MPTQIAIRTSGARQPGSDGDSASTMAQLASAKAVANATTTATTAVRSRAARASSGMCREVVSWTSRRTSVLALRPTFSKSSEVSGSACLCLFGLFAPLGALDLGRIFGLVLGRGLLRYRDGVIRNGLVDLVRHDSPPSRETL